MDDTCLCLTWNDHGATYQQMLNVLRIQNVLTDCTLACDGQKFNVHKLVLVTCSDFFKSVLEDVSHQHPIIYLRGVSGKEMEILIDFMYLGKIDVPQKFVTDLLSTAKSLRIKGLGVLNPTVKSDPDLPSSKKSRLFEVPVNDSSTLLPYQTISSPFVKYNVSVNSNLSSQEASQRSELTVASHFQPKEHILPLESQTNSSQSVDTDPSHSVVTIPSHSLLNYTENEYMFPSMSKSSLINLEPSQIHQYSIAHSSSSEISRPNFIPMSVEGNGLITKPPNDNFDFTDQTRAQLHIPERTKAFIINESLVSNSRGSGEVSLVPDKIAAGKNCGKMGKIKEEALDYTQAYSSDPRLPSTIPLLPQCPKSSLEISNTSSRIPVKDDTTQDFSLVSKYPDSHTPFIQDENVENVDALDRPHMCPICHKSFAKQAILKRHHLAHFRPYNCHICPRSFTRREVLAEHVLEHNGADLRLPCPVCNMAIKRKRNLQAHIKVKHPEYHRHLKSAD